MLLKHVGVLKRPLIITNVVLPIEKGYEICIRDYKICNNPVNRDINKGIWKKKSTFFNKFGRRTIVGFPKAFGKIGMVVKTNGITYLGNIDL